MQALVLHFNHNKLEFNTGLSLIYWTYPNHLRKCESSPALSVSRFRTAYSSLKLLILSYQKQRNLENLCVHIHAQVS